MKSDYIWHKRFFIVENSLGEHIIARKEGRGGGGGGG